MSMSEMVSVIVPVYKVEDYLDECISSLVNQTYKNLEIILIDDGSPDQCPSLCDAWAGKDKRIRVIHKENGGVSSARNVGLQTATGSWISFVDSDDWLHPQFFEILIELAEQKGADVVAGGFIRTDEKQDSFEISPQFIQSDFLDIRFLERWKGIFYVWGKIYYREVIDGFDFDESLSYGEDAIFNISAFYRKSIEVVCTKETLYYYRIRQGSSVSEDRSKKRVTLCRAYMQYAENEQNNACKEIYLSRAIKRALSTRFDIRFDRKRRSVVQACNEILLGAIREYRKIKPASSNNSARYCLFYEFPAVYTLFRIVNDPSLLRLKKHKERIDSLGGR